MDALILAAGLGTRLLPYTQDWPKCLMPIGGRPLLFYWLDRLKRLGVKRIFINVHFEAEYVRDFIQAYSCDFEIIVLEENVLLGTGGTLQNLVDSHKLSKLLVVIHADNFMQDHLSGLYQAFLDERIKNKGVVGSLVCFSATDPKSCGILKICDCIMVGFDEKPSHPLSNLANGAVYIFDVDGLKEELSCLKISDISRDLMPNLIGKIAIWKTESIFCDIGSPAALIDINITLRNNLIEYSSISFDPEWWEKFFSKTQCFHELKKTGIEVNIHG